MLEEYGKQQKKMFISCAYTYFAGEGESRRWKLLFARKVKVRCCEGLYRAFSRMPPLLPYALRLMKLWSAFFFRSASLWTTTLSTSSRSLFSFVRCLYMCVFCFRDGALRNKLSQKTALDGTGRVIRRVSPPPPTSPKHDKKIDSFFRTWYGR